MSVPTALPETISAAGLTFSVRTSPRRKSIGITVGRDGDLVIHAPTGCKPETLRGFATDKRLWIYSKLAEKDLLLSPRPVKEIVDGEGFVYLGRSYRLQRVAGSSGSVRLHRGRLQLSTENTDGARDIISWYRRTAHRWLSTRVPRWAERMGVAPTIIDVRDLGYRWGSLGTSNRVNFHWATIQLPPRLVDYVIVHELAHVTHSTHTAEFWLGVERVFPDYARAKAELATVGARVWLGDSRPIPA